MSRGPRRYTFTLNDIAAAAGKTYQTVLRDLHPIDDKPPRLDPHSLVSLAEYVTRGRQRESK